MDPVTVIVVACLVFMTGLVWCGAVQMVSIARSLRRLVEMHEQRKT